ncbi:transketolase 1 [Trichonephila clavata]|uniref:transketolase n=1 Tax=Trichonephila clavata TaxID=2740835 RepID=A0A8X6HC86_TRICU|nr:transketolase 1 [Trichonephila clavata]
MSDKKNIENIRTLAVDIVQNANSGHPGAPLGLATFVYTLYKDYLKFDPDNDEWTGRDIFILSNGHACVIQYIMNYFIGYLTLDDLKNFRSLNSRTPGHPERQFKGIEVTSGPLGQGLANSVGFAISLKKLDLKNMVYCVFGDGCYQEGIGQESFSIASNLNLDNITFIYDYNNSTIDGPTSLSMNENVEKRFKSLNFHVTVVDGENIEEIKKALNFEARKPKVIILQTMIGRDSILEGNSKSHGSPIGEEGVRKLKEKYGIPQEKFYISNQLKEEFDAINERKRKITKELDDKTNHEMIKKLKLKDLSDESYSCNDEITTEKLATRKIFSNLLNDLKDKECLICGSADLASSVLCKLNEGNDFTNENFKGNYINFGIREHAMCGVMTGIASHGFYMPICGTFLNFIAYGYPSVRLASLDKLNTVYVLSHDSICLGEDGPTHQPIETLLTLRSTPNLITMRPCDIKECKAALNVCLSKQGPKAVILTRQKVPFIEHTCKSKALKGAYYLIEHPNPDLIIMGTGSEIELCYQVLDELKELNIH